MKKGRWILFASLWLGAVVAGSVGLMIYSLTPGEQAEAAPKTWPVSSGLARAADQPTLIMFAHPKCPCTRASIGELAQLMTQCQGRVKAQVVFLRPEGSGEDWTQTDLWKSAAAIPGVSVRADTDGREAAKFQATTSGHVVLYDAEGQLLFSGGITEARGHAGDNEGRSDIVGILHHRTISGNTTPTFGCPLQGCPVPQAPRQGS